MSNTITLATPCFNIENGQIVEGTLADFSSYIESTTRPNGVGYKYYVTTVTRNIERDTETIDEDAYPQTETVEADVWVLAKWATWAGPQVVVQEFKTEADAAAAAEATYVHDIRNNSEQEIYLDRAAAEQFLHENRADL